MAKPNDADKIYIIKPQAKNLVVPGTAYGKSKRSQPDDFTFMNLAGKQATVANNPQGQPFAIAGPVVIAYGQMATLRLQGNLADGAYEYSVDVDGQPAQGNSAPRIIIDG